MEGKNITGFKYKIIRFLGLKILDILGREVETLFDGFYQAGRHQILWHAGQLPSGPYLVRLKTGDFVETKKLMLQK